MTRTAGAGPAFTRIAKKAQPLWLTDFYDNPTEAASAYVARAAAAQKTPLLVVYNIPDRDCGMYSSQDDQITDRHYRRYVDNVAQALDGSKSIVVLEPDAVAFIGSPTCAGVGDRLTLLRYAARTLTMAGA